MRKLTHLSKATAESILFLKSFWSVHGTRALEVGFKKNLIPLARPAYHSSQQGMVWQGMENGMEILV